MDDATAPVKAAISYAHGARDPEILALANRLNSEGVDCEIDAYDDAPSEGWERWMIDKMTTRVVLVVCSEAYYRRFHLKEPLGVGRGATFESGLLVQRAFEDQGRNDSLIPVVFDSSEVKWIPEFLRGVTRYVLPAGYDKLYARLTGQGPRKPPLGQVRVLGSPGAGAPASIPLARREPADTSHFVLLQTPKGFLWAPYSELRREEGRLSMTIAPRDPEEAAQIDELRHQSQEIGLAYGNNAMMVKVRKHREIIERGSHRVEMELEEERFSSSFGSDGSYNNISADELATMRARRILLDEKLPSRGGDRTVAMLNDRMLDAFVGGQYSGQISVNASPIPALWKDLGGDEPEKLAMLRLVCVLLLRLSGTVERITKLDLQPKNKHQLHVEFSGVRAKIYSNREPTTVSVSGDCPLI